MPAIDLARLDSATVDLNAGQLWCGLGLGFGLCQGAVFPRLGSCIARSL